MTAGIPADSHTTITAADGTVVAVPDEYVCPLTLDVMEEPYLSPEGHNYERSAIMKWVAEYGSSPMTREKLLPSYLSRNRALETKIRLFLMQNGVTPSGKNLQDAKSCMSVQESMSLLESFSLPNRTSLEESQSTPVTEENLAERRRQIADLIGSAMSELDDF